MYSCFATDMMCVYSQVFIANQKQETQTGLGEVTQMVKTNIQHQVKLPVFNYLWTNYNIYDVKNNIYILCRNERQIMQTPNNLHAKKYMHLDDEYTKFE